MYENLNSRGIPKPKEVEPIKKMKDIEKIEQYLSGKDNRRDYIMSSYEVQSQDYENPKGPGKKD